MQQVMTQTFTHLFIHSLISFPKYLFQAISVLGIGETAMKKKQSLTPKFLSLAGDSDSVCSRAHRGDTEPRLEESGKSSWRKLSRQRWKVSQAERIAYGRPGRRFKHLKVQAAWDIVGVEEEGL